MRKVTASNLTTGMLTQNFKNNVHQFISSNEAFNFMNSNKSTPAYRKKFLHEVLGMVKQLSPPSFFKIILRKFKVG